MSNATAGARRYLSIFGAGTLVVGLIYLFAPLYPMALVGIDSLAAPASIDVRATYGGTQIGVGVFLLWSAACASRVRSGLVVLALIVGAVAAGRAVGLLMDGLVALHAQATVAEAVRSGDIVYRSPGTSFTPEGCPGWKPTYDANASSSTATT